MVSSVADMREDEQDARPSRYRSVRQQTTPAAPGHPSAVRTASAHRDPGQQQQHHQHHQQQQPDGNAAGSSISRSMSRYRRRAASVTADAQNDHVAQTVNPGPHGDTPPVPAIPASLDMGGHDEHAVGSPPVQRTLRRTGKTMDDMYARAVHDGNSININNSQKIASGLGTRDVPRVVSRREEEREDGEEGEEREEEEERDRLLEEQKRKDLQRLEEQLESSQRAKAQLQRFRSPVVDKFMALTKGSKNGGSHGEMPPASPVATSSSSAAAGSSGGRRPDWEPAKTLPAHIEPGGRGIVPQKDAPASAINAGDRNVTVRYRHHTFRLRVTPETTAVDIIAQASGQMAYDAEMSPERCLVVERYSILGLERRVRRYERIRDVMNSWDGDAQNHLAIVLPGAHENHEDLFASAVVDSEEPPSGCQLYVYHSNRPGKWNKRWVTLLQTGQIICTKRPSVKTTGKDATCLCHLSDYDVYTPTESQLKRHIKPPKRFCFAIKSQHKTTLFLNTDNYVQYFSTEDPAVARELKQRAHDWRSWYLVDRHPGARTDEDRALRRPDNAAAANGQRLRASADESPYSIGQFEPLLDMKRFDKQLSQLGSAVPTPQSDPLARQTADHKIRRRLSKREKSDTRHPQGPKGEGQDGFTGGLLGEEYDNRRQALDDSEEKEKKKKKRPQELAFTGGPSLLNNQRDPGFATEQPPESPPWFPSAQEHAAGQQCTHHQTTAVRPSPDSGHVATGRHYSLSAASHRLAGLVPSVARSSTQHASQHAYSRTHTQQQQQQPPHPDPLKSQPTGLPYSGRNAPVKPLVDLTPKFQEPPQWSKDKKGHGVKPPEGLGHLVDFISVGTGTDSTSNRSVLRRPTTSGSAPPGRTRSMSAATSSGRPLLDNAPPVPLLPSRPGVETAPVGRDGRVERRETVRHGERPRDQGQARHRGREREQRDREYRERDAAYNAVPGRMGTLKVV